MQALETSEGRRRCVFLTRLTVRTRTVTRSFLQLEILHARGGAKNPAEFLARKVVHLEGIDATQVGPNAVTTSFSPCSNSGVGMRNGGVFEGESAIRSVDLPRWLLLRVMRAVR